MPQKKTTKASPGGEEACRTCGKPATCVGVYEGHGESQPSCDDCCGHGNEDGCCEPLTTPAPPLRDGLRKALVEAAQSLETIAQQAGRDELLADLLQVRGYANSRATAARAALVRRAVEGDAPSVLSVVRELLEAAPEEEPGDPETSNGDDYARLGSERATYHWAERFRAALAQEEKRDDE